MACKFSKSRDRNGGIVELYCNLISKNDNFRHLGLIIYKDGKIEEDGHRIRAGG